MDLTDIYQKGEENLRTRDIGFLLDGVETGFITVNDRRVIDQYTFRQQCIDGTEPDPLALDFPDVDDGLRGMLFLETLVKSAASREKWTPFGT